MQIKISAISDTGCVRERNEDMVLVGEHLFRDDGFQTIVDLNEEGGKYLVAIADGMGGHNAGEVASEMVLQKMVEKINSLETNLTEAELSCWISKWTKDIHLAILTEGQKDIERKGMGTTFIGLLFYEGNLYYVNVGDSRLYRFRGGMLMQISRDHSLRELTNNPEISSNIITNSFGGDEKIFVNFEVASKKILAGDIFLLCSDGLSDMINDERIERILSNEGNNLIKELLSKAKENGGKDNISIILVSILYGVTVQV